MLCAKACFCYDFLFFLHFQYHGCCRHCRCCLSLLLLAFVLVLYLSLIGFSFLTFFFFAVFILPVALPKSTKKYIESFWQIYGCNYIFFFIFFTYSVCPDYTFTFALALNIIFLSLPLRSFYHIQICTLLYHHPCRERASAFVWIHVHSLKIPLPYADSNVIHMCPFFASYILKWNELKPLF